MKYLYEIAGLTVWIQTDGDIDYGPLQSFATCHSSSEFPIDWAEADLAIRVAHADMIAKPEGTLLSDGDAKWVAGGSDGRQHVIYIPDPASGEILCRADVHADWSRAEIACLNHHPASEIAVYGFLCEILFRNRLHVRNGLVIHASGIAWQGNGLLFTAPSGTGKSTHAGLWVEHLGAKVLNDDRPALRVADQIVDMYGTPWSGSKFYYQNDQVPLKAIMLLEQAAENQISRVQAAEAAAGIMPRCFLPYYNKVMMDKALTVLNDILAAVPVYRLCCRPDREAAALVREYLF